MNVPCPPPGGLDFEEIVPLVPAANKAFTPEELDERIAMHAARVEREEEQYRKLNRPDERGRSQAKGHHANGNAPLKADWKTCRCAGCSCRLFGESMRDVPGLPGYTEHVAGRTDGRPYCKACLKPKRKRTA